MPAEVYDAAAAEATSESEATEESGSEDLEAGAGKRAWLGIPYRPQQVLINWVFIGASVTLLLDFLSLQNLLSDLANPGSFAELCNWFGVVSCLLWLLGFIVLAHWLHSVGATSMGLAGCYMKLVASIFFNLQPMTGTMNDPMFSGGFPKGGGAGLWWSNLVGILFFHFGNIVSCLDFYLHTPPGASKKKGWLYHGNLPVTAMWVYQAATWLLVAANALSCSFNGATWAPIVPTKEAPVYICQYGGASLLLVGSLIYANWCGGFHDWSNPPLGAPGVESECSGSDSDEPKLGSGFPFLAEARLIPYRAQQVLLNWVFIVASVTLLLDFMSLQTLLADPVHQGYFAELCNWFGVVSCIGWFLGFVLLAHWLRSVGATSMGLAGCYMKLVAAVLFNLQPMTGTMNDPLLSGGFTRGGGAGFWWSNLIGILFFHTGNLVSCLDFFLHTPPGADKSQGWLYHGNLPITAMWIYQSATWLLVAANAMSCSFDGADWAPLVATSEDPVKICQYGGALLLLLGSVVYTVWCAGFHDLSNQPL